ELSKVGDSVTVKLNELKDLAQNLANFLKERVGVDVSVQGDTLVVSRSDNEKLNARRLKVYLKRFLHIEGLRKKYRVLIKSGELNFIKIKEEG
ncbi:MAG: hypothetical protein QXE57_00320, partial [Nitrososphaerales archaeon]